MSDESELKNGAGLSKKNTLEQWPLHKVIANTHTHTTMDDLGFISTTTARSGFVCGRWRHSRSHTRTKFLINIDIAQQ